VTQQFHAKTLKGLEEVLAGELKAIGATDVVPVNRGVNFSGSVAMMYKANLYLRTALRILMPISKFRALNEDMLYRFKYFKITKEQIDRQSDKTVMIARPSMKTDLEHIKNLENGTFIYSVWSGYKKEDTTQEFIRFLTGRGMIEKEIHTSGHADRKALKRMVEVLKPKNLVPIHTFEGDKYEKIFTGTKVLRIDDNEIIS